MRIAFQGTAGAFGEAALMQRFGADVERITLASFGDVFDAVESGEADAGVVPIENSLAGSVLETYDLLVQHEAVEVVGEITLAVRHCLLGAPRATVLRQPTALAKPPTTKKRGITCPTQVAATYHGSSCRGLVTRTPWSSDATPTIVTCTMTTRTTQAVRMRSTTRSRFAMIPRTSGALFACSDRPWLVDMSGR